jgi:hypothetical protein
MIEIPSVFVEQYIMQYVGYPKTSGGKIVGGCPYCHEDSSWGKKSRFYYYPETISCHCFNCGVTKSGYLFIKDQTGMSFREIAKEVKEELGEDIVKGELIYTENETQEPVSVIPPLPPNCIDLLDFNVDYIEGDYFTELAVSEIRKRRLDTACNRPQSLYLSKDDFIHKNRIIIPFYDERKELVFYQSRALTKRQRDEYGKYVSKLDGDKTICGVDRIDPYHPNLFIFEGPFDSFFVKNGLAVTGLRLTELQARTLESLSALYNVVWCLDNHFDNKDTRDSYESLISAGENVFLWDDETTAKDLNQKCIEDGVDGVDPEWILDRTYTGRKASRILAQRLRR